MAQQTRINAVLENISRPGRSVQWPQKDGKPKYISEIYGSNVFGLKRMQDSLPKTVYARFVQQIKGKQPLDKATADAIAHAVRVWSMDLGATHFTHWFQPQVRQQLI